MPRAVLDAHDAQQVRTLAADLPLREIAGIFGVSVATVSSVIHGRTHATPPAPPAATGRGLPPAQAPLDLSGVLRAAGAVGAHNDTSSAKGGCSGGKPDGNQWGSGQIHVNAFRRAPEPTAPACDADAKVTDKGVFAARARAGGTKARTCSGGRCDAGCHEPFPLLPVLTRANRPEITRAAGRTTTSG